MNAQLSIDFAPPITRRAFVALRSRRMAAVFCDDFPDWLEQNFTIWERFECEANAIYSSGRKHYSARTIGEFIRHETALQAAADGDWKINNNRFPDLARLWLHLYPERAGFFELRENEKRKAA